MNGGKHGTNGGVADAGLRFLIAAEPVQLRVDRFLLELPPVVVDVDHPPRDVIGLVGRQKQRQIDLFFRGNAAGHAHLASRLDLTPASAVACCQDLIGHMRVRFAGRETVHLHVMLGDFLRQAFDETHDRGFSSAVNGEIRPGRQGTPHAGDYDDLAAAPLDHLRQHGATSIQHAQAQAADARPRTLLYVEDNPANLELVEQLIARRPDLRLLSAADGDLGIEFARTYQPEVILMDINLPGISGIAALKILRADSSTAHIPVIALSANAVPHDIARALNAGFFNYLTKPIKVDQFMEALDVALKFSETSPRRAIRVDVA